MSFRTEARVTQPVRSSARQLMLKTSNKEHKPRVSAADEGGFALPVPDPCRSKNGSRAPSWGDPIPPASEQQQVIIHDIEEAGSIPGWRRGRFEEPRDRRGGR